MSHASPRCPVLDAFLADGKEPLRAGKINLDTLYLRSTDEKAGWELWSSLCSSQSDGRFVREYLQALYKSDSFLKLLLAVFDP